MEVIVRIVGVGSNVTCRLLISVLGFVRYWQTNGSRVSYSLTSRKPMIQVNGIIVQYSDRFWDYNETSQVD
jgi:hypothetical protein